MFPLGWAIKEYGAQDAVAVVAVALLVFAVLSVFLLPKIRQVR